MVSSDLTGESSPVKGVRESTHHTEVFLKRGEVLGDSLRQQQHLFDLTHLLQQLFHTETPTKVCLLVRGQQQSHRCAFQLAGHQNNNQVCQSATGHHYNHTGVYQ